MSKIAVVRMGKPVSDQEPSVHTTSNTDEDPSCQETIHPHERILPLFSAGVQAERRSPLAMCSVFISIGWCLQRDGTKHLLRVSCHCDGSNREFEYGALCPRNISVPSCRPMQTRGCTRGVRQLGPGSGEGQHTST
jgi:hypothetical protein